MASALLQSHRLDSSIENAMSFTALKGSSDRCWTGNKHCLIQLGLTEPSLENLILESTAKSDFEVAEHFRHAHVHKIKKSGLSNDDLSLLNSYISESDQNKFLVTLDQPAKIDSNCHDHDGFLVWSPIVSRKNSHLRK